MTAVLDASAMLAYLKGESGAEVVEELLDAGTSCSAANWSEIAQKVLGAGRDWGLARALLVSYGIAVKPVVVEDAEWAAGRWRPREGLSLANRLCLALAHRYGLEVWTADSAWGTGPGIHQIR